MSQVNKMSSSVCLRAAKVAGRKKRRKKRCVSGGSGTILLPNIQTAATASKRRKMNEPETVILFTLIYTFFVFASNQLAADAIAPTIDYSHNMRVLKLPKSVVQVGDLIYRLKGSDADANNRLTFGSASPQARSLLDIVPISEAGHWNEADVYLKSALSEPVYNLTIFVSDGNKTTQVESTIFATTTDASAGETGSIELNKQSLLEAMRVPHNNIGCNSTSRLQAMLASTSGLLPTDLIRLSPFVAPKQVFTVAENTGVGEPIGSVSVLERSDSDLAVKFELRGSGADHFNIKYVFGPHGQARGELQLARPLDYEHQNLYLLKVLALNAWTYRELDTRNVHSLDIVIAVGDVQDTGPAFNKPDLIATPGASQPAQVWQPILVSNRMQIGDLLTRVEARDGDAGDQRPIQYALDASSQLAEFFDIDKATGDIRLAKPVEELVALSELINLDPSVPFQLSVFASELPDATSYEHLWPPMFARIELPLQLVDAHNDPPQFKGGWQTEEPRTGARSLHAYLFAPSKAHSQGSSLEDRHSFSNTIVFWYTNNTSSTDDAATGSGRHPFVVDSNRGSNGTFELSLEGADAHLFQVEPSYAVVHKSNVNLYVKPSELFRFSRTADRQVYHLDLVARDFGSKMRLASKIGVAIELIDAGEKSPQFESDLYAFSVYENSQAGTIVGSVRARIDRAPSAALRYTSLTGTGSNLFKLDPESGVLSLETSGHLDREQAASYLFIVEARNAAASGAANYTRVIINVLDVNDNAPVFTQASYDAVLMIQNTATTSVVGFQQPLVVKASDADEPNTANSQVAYEIIAGNANEHFTIDSLSGAIYPTNSASTNKPTSLPSILSDPIRPHHTASSSSRQHGGFQSPGREIEDTTVASSATSDHRASTSRLSFDAAPSRAPRQRFDQLPSFATRQPEVDNATDQVQAADLLLSLESAALERAPAREAELPAVGSSAARIEPRRNTAHLSSGAVFASMPPPVTTLIVRAHDFGVPLRSSTAKVNIYNPILSNRYLSVILNGTAEQLEQRRDSIERTFGAVVGAKAVIESIDALSDSSQLSVARVKLTVPQSNLVDLTDLSALMQAIEYRSFPAAEAGRIGGGGSGSNSAASPVTHYVAFGDRLIPAANISSLGGQYTVPLSAQHPTQQSHHYTDIQSYAMDATALERRLLIYIIIVGVCILALLVIWMVYSCSRENELKIVDTTNLIASEKDRKRQSGAANKVNTTQVKARLSPIANQLYAKQPLVVLPAGSQLIQESGKQLWFEPSDRYVRASSAPSSGQVMLGGRQSSELVAPLDGALYATIAGSSRRMHVVGSRAASNQFFPNTIGYTENLSSLLLHSDPNQTLPGGRVGKAQRRSKVAPMQSTGSGHQNDGYEDDDDEDPVASTRRHRSQHNRHAKQAEVRRRQTTGVQTSIGATEDSGDSSAHTLAGADESSVGAESVVLDSDQELLGFDSSGAPIIATHTGTPADAKQQQVSGVVAQTTSGAQSKAEECSKTPAPKERSRQQLLRRQTNATDELQTTNNNKVPKSASCIAPTGSGVELPVASRSATLASKADSKNDRDDASSVSSAATMIQAGGGGQKRMKNGELLEKQSIFAITYSGVATDKLPAI